jgi:hypothetical protein
MKKFLSVLTILVLLGVWAVWAWPYTEGTKKMCVPDTKVCVTISERAPDFISFPTHVVGTQPFENGNAIQILEAVNEAETVDAVIAVVKVGDTIGIIGLVAVYIPEGLRHFDSTKQHVTDSYEDVAFTKTGRISGVLARVDKLTDYSEFKKFLTGTKI